MTVFAADFGKTIGVLPMETHGQSVIWKTSTAITAAAR
jgi:hypothetical protein